LAMLAGIGVHLFTASGAGLAFLALVAAIDRDFPTMFTWLGAAFLVDAVDGSLARRLRIEDKTPFIDGAILDLVVDFLTYVLVPAVALWRSDLVPASISLALAVLICAASALYFADRRMKTPDNWFRGFPALWNVAIFELFVFRPPAFINATVLAILVVLMFTPFATVHPFRVRALRPVTILMTVVWAASAMLATIQNLEPGSIVKTILVVATLYFPLLSFLKHERDTG
jgi:phosphatidylcholine synthase